MGTPNGTPPTPSAPMDTASIAARNLEALEGPSAPDPDPTPTPTPDGNGAPPVTPPTGSTPPTVSDAEQMLRDAGYVTESKPDGRYHYIPRWKVLEMIESGLRSRGEKAAKERADLEAQVRASETDRAAVTRWRQMMAGDPRALLAEMARLDPRYQSFLAPPV